MKIAVAQINVTVGDFAGNAEKMRKAVDAARAAGARLVVGPEMGLSGYPAEDLWLRDGWHRRDPGTQQLGKSNPPPVGDLQPWLALAARIGPAACPG